MKLRNTPITWVHICVFTSVSAFVLIFMFISTITSSSQKQESESESVKIPTYSVNLPPKSLDQYYPPKSNEPVFLYAMFGFSGGIGGLMTSIRDGNWEKAQTYFDAFKTQYKQVSSMVPEWQEYFPSKPLDELGEVLNNKNSEKTQGAIQQVGAVCGRCHEKNRLAVWYRYEWKDFRPLTVADPESGEKIPWIEYMFALSGSFSATNTYLSEQQFDKAAVALKRLQSRLENLKEGCIACHDTERRYFVSQDIQDLLSKAVTELNQGQPDPGKIGGFLQKAGMDSCYKCHLVHVPAAVVHEAWTVH